MLSNRKQSDDDGGLVEIEMDELSMHPKVRFLFTLMKLTVLAACKPRT